MVWDKIHDKKLLNTVIKGKNDSRDVKISLGKEDGGSASH
jgi:hypothetical protein